MQYYKYDTLQNSADFSIIYAVISTNRIPVSIGQSDILPFLKNVQLEAFDTESAGQLTNGSIHLVPFRDIHHSFQISSPVNIPSVEVRD